MSLNFRLAEVEDAKGIFEVQRKTWITTYPNPELSITLEYVKERIEGKNNALFSKRISTWKNLIQISPIDKVMVAEYNGAIVGFLDIGLENPGKIIALYVLAEHQNQGIGSLLLSYAFQYFKPDQDIYLNVASYNHQAISFYKKFGFNPTYNLLGKNSTDLIPEIEMFRRGLKS